jgi:hypothetical protein
LQNSAQIPNAFSNYITQFQNNKSFPFFKEHGNFFKVMKKIEELCCIHMTQFGLCRKVLTKAAIGRERKLVD